MEFKLETPKQHVSFFKFKFVKHFIQNEETKKIIPFYHLTEKYLMRSESILNSVSILSSHILNNMGFSAHWETESVTAEVIQLLRNKNLSQEAIVYVFMLQEHKKSSYYFPFVRNLPTQRYLAGLRRWRNMGGLHYTTKIFLI